MLGIFLIFVGFINANAFLDKGGHLMYVEYSISEPVKEQGVLYVDILFHYKGETYMVARHMYPEPVVSIVDTFPWVSKDRWEGGDLEVVARKADGSVERSYISEESIEIRDLGYELPEFEWRVNSAFVKLDKGPDPYSWRMLGYDPGHTGYYPFSLYPPLDSLWMYDWSGAGTWTTEISGCAGHDMLFIPLAPWGWNRIAAFDVGRGDTIWERVVTANVWTSALSLDDSTLFVGTSIGFTPWKDTTFYALDPFTGELKWGKSLKTVEYSPIVVDTFVYAPHFYKVYCFTYSGDSLWADEGGYISPVYANGKIIGVEQDTIIDARDWLSGKLLWRYIGRGWIEETCSCQGKLIVSEGWEPLKTLFVESGTVAWVNPDYVVFNLPFNCAFNKVYFVVGDTSVADSVFFHFVALNITSGALSWDTVIAPYRLPNTWSYTRSVATKDTLLWTPKLDILYVMRGDRPEMLYSFPLNDSSAQFTAWYFPIGYKNKLILADDDYLMVFEADTVDTSRGRGSDELFFVKYNNGKLFFDLTLPRGGKISLRIYDVTGRLVSYLDMHLDRGTHEIPLWVNLKEGVYIVRFDGNGNSISRKFFVINRR